MKKLILLLSIFLAFGTDILSGQTVYITNTGEKYHTSNCRYLSRSKIQTTLSEALSSGYDPCKVCKPTTVVTSSKTRVKVSEKSDENEQTGTVQCLATTKAGARCKRTTKSANGYCYQHGGN